MPRIYKNEETVFNWLDLVLELDMLNGRPIPAIVTLNDGEWRHLLMCIDTFPKYSGLQVDRDNRQLMYRGVKIVWDGTDYSSTDFLSDIGYLRDRVDNFNAEGLAIAPDRTGTAIIRTAPVANTIGVRQGLAVPNPQNMG